MNIDISTVFVTDEKFSLVLTDQHTPRFQAVTKYMPFVGNEVSWLQL